MKCSPSAMTLTSLSTTARQSQFLLDEPGHVEPVPAGHDRRIGRTPGGVLHRAGETNADPGEIGDVAAGLVEELAAVVEHPPQHGLGSERDVEVDVLVRQHGRRQVGHGEPDVGRADVGGEDHASGGVERELGRWTASRGGRLASRRRRASRPAARRPAGPRSSARDRWRQRARCGCAARRRAAVWSRSPAPSTALVKHTHLLHFHDIFCLTSGRSDVGSASDGPWGTRGEAGRASTIPARTRRPDKHEKLEDEAGLRRPRRDRPHTRRGLRRRRRR